MNASSYVNLSTLAREIGLPALWLKREADAGRIPCLKVGRRRMFDVAAVRVALASREQKGAARG